MIWSKSPETRNVNNSPSLYPLAAKVVGMWPRVCQSDATSPFGLWYLIIQHCRGEQQLFLKVSAARPPEGQQQVTGGDHTLRTSWARSSVLWNDPDHASFPWFLPFSWGWIFLIPRTVKSPIAFQQTPFLLQLLLVSVVCSKNLTDQVTMI